MNSSIENINGEGMAGTFFLADGFDRQHGSITRLIEKYKEDFEVFQDLKSRKIKTKGRPVIEYLEVMAKQLELL